MQEMGDTLIRTQSSNCDFGDALLQILKKVLGDELVPKEIDRAALSLKH